MTGFTPAILASLTRMGPDDHRPQQRRHRARQRRECLSGRTRSSLFESPFIKEICILGINGNGGAAGGGILHAIVVPDMDEFRRRGQTAIMEMIRFEIENLSKQVPSYYRIHSLAIRNEPLPRTVTRKLKRFEIQQEEIERRKAKEAGIEHPSSPREDDERFKSRVGVVIAELVREAKPDIRISGSFNEYRTRFGVRLPRSSRVAWPGRSASWNACGRAASHPHFHVGRAYRRVRGGVGFRSGHRPFVERNY